MGHEGRARIHEHTYEDGHHRIRQDIDMDEGVAHEDSRQHGKDNDEGIEHRDAARLLEIVLTIEAQIQREAYHEDGDIKDMADERYLVLGLVLIAAVVLLDV